MAIYGNIIRVSYFKIYLRFMMLIRISAIYFMALHHILISSRYIHIYIYIHIELIFIITSSSLGNRSNNIFHIIPPDVAWSGRWAMVAGQTVRSLGPHLGIPMSATPSVDSD